MEFLDRIDRFHKTQKGYLLFAIIELVLAYIFVSIAIDTASMWAYLATLILFVGFIMNITRVFREPHPVSENNKLRLSKTRRKKK